MWLQGNVPPIEELLGLYNMITQSGDLRQPVQLEKQLMEDDSMEKEVGMAMVQLLRVSSRGGFGADMLWACMAGDEWGPMLQLLRVSLADVDSVTGYLGACAAAAAVRRRGHGQGHAAAAAVRRRGHCQGHGAAAVGEARQRCGSGDSSCGCVRWKLYMRIPW